MRILELNNKKHYEITEKEFQIVKASSAGASGVLIELPRLQLVINSFAITSIEPVRGQIGQGLPYLIEGKNSRGAFSSWRAFLRGGRYIYQMENGGTFYEINKQEIEDNGYSVYQEDEILEKRHKLRMEYILKEETRDEKKQLK